MKNLCFFLFILVGFCSFSQTKVQGKVTDASGVPIAFANIVFKDSYKGVVSNEDGVFYLESDTTYKTLVVSFVGFTTKEIPLTQNNVYNIEVVLQEGEQLQEVVVYSGKQSKKNNPAVDLLKKIWGKKRSNGIHKFRQYQYDTYEKVEFDLNSIDSTFMQSRLFKGMEFVFDKIDTSAITGKTYLPIFINETFYTTYGSRVFNKERKELKGNKNSGLGNSEGVNAFIEKLYPEYNIYDNYMTFFDKSFVSPLSKTGVDVYNYVLSDSTFIDNKWCYHIVYYPRRKNELTFKGSFWVNDTTYAIKKIDLQLVKSANVNWVKEVYIEQEFDVVNDSVFLLKRDYMLSDFSLNKKEKSRGVYGKRTTIYDNYVFDKEKAKSFYDKVSLAHVQELYEKDDAFWQKNRLEKLNKDELGVYQMLDTLKTVPKFKRLYSLGTVLATGYVEIPGVNLFYGPIFSSVGNNAVEGLRLRAGVRTYFGPNDLWRLQGYGAYGFRDKAFKFGISGKWLVDQKNRIILSAGYRKDIEQTAESLIASNDVLGRSFASSSFLTTGVNNKLTKVSFLTAGIATEFMPNVVFKTAATHKTMQTAIDAFPLVYQGISDIDKGVTQFSITSALDYTPGKKATGYGVERSVLESEYPRFYLSYTFGEKDMVKSDFSYKKLQFYYRQPIQIGGFGRFAATLQAGKTFADQLPLVLLDVLPGNQSYFTIGNAFSNLNFYEFVTDTYTSLHVEHNFNGRIFSRIPLLRKLNLREIVGFRGAWGMLSDKNKIFNTPVGVPLIAPEHKIYWEYSVGVGNIFKVLRIDCNFRGNYLDAPDARKFSITGAFGFYF